MPQRNDPLATPDDAERAEQDRSRGLAKVYQILFGNMAMPTPLDAQPSNGAELDLALQQSEAAAMPNEITQQGRDLWRQLWTVGFDVRKAWKALSEADKRLLASEAAELVQLVRQYNDDQAAA